MNELVSKSMDKTAGYFLKRCWASISEEATALVRWIIPCFMTATAPNLMTSCCEQVEAIGPIP